MLREPAHYNAAPTEINPRGTAGIRLGSGGRARLKRGQAEDVILGTGPFGAGRAGLELTPPASPAILKVGLTRLGGASNP